MEYDDTNRGASFINDRKTTASHPDYRGSINVDGVEYWISSWVKEAGPTAKNPGQQFLSHSLTKKEQATATYLTTAPIAAEAQTTDTTNDGGFSPPAFKDVPVDDDIPF